MNPLHKSAMAFQDCENVLYNHHEETKKKEKEKKEKKLINIK